jgi:hypothetical protein
MNNPRLLLVAAAGLLLAGCNSISQSMGLDPISPDEFNVVTKAPLILPPDFALRPPVPGAPRPQETQPRQQAQAALLNPGGVGNVVMPVMEAQDRTMGEVALLAYAGAVNPDPGVRALVDLENAQLLNQADGFLEQILSWQQPRPDVIDPVAEAERLRSAGGVAVPGPTARQR